MEKHLQLGLSNDCEEAEREAFRTAVPITMPIMACSAMQACYVMIMTLYKVKSTLVSDQVSAGSTFQSGRTFLENERLVEELRHGVKDSLDMLKKYCAEFAHIRAMHDELQLVYQVAFADI